MKKNCEKFADVRFGSFLLNIILSSDEHLQYVLSVVKKNEKSFL